MINSGKKQDETVEPGKKPSDTGALDMGPGVCIDHAHLEFGNYLIIIIIINIIIIPVVTNKTI